MCLIIKNGTLVNNNIKEKKDILIEDGKIKQISDLIKNNFNCEEFDASGKYILPGIIDTHVHFRDPGLTSKADIYAESRAAAAGGVTTFFDMPNTVPQTTKLEQWQEKNSIARQKSILNYAFYIGATTGNLDFLSNAQNFQIPAIKVFFASSTGNMLLNNDEKIRLLFRKTNLPLVIHSEDNDIINKNIKKFKLQNKNNAIYHHLIRGTEACFEATKYLINLAKQYNKRVHFLHISTKKELELFDNQSVNDKIITAEVTPNHLFFDNRDYEILGNKIKCNPAIKTEQDKLHLQQALMKGLIDTIGTDHAPHLIEEKEKLYFDAPSGIPSIQHSLNIMLDFVKQGVLSIEKLVELMSHNPAKIFGIEKRGFVKEDYWADLTIVDLNGETKLEKNTLLYKCGWSPLEGHIFKNKIVETIVNGQFVYRDGKILENNAAQQVAFSR